MKNARAVRKGPGHQHAGIPDHVPLRRAARIRAQDIPCPDCKADTDVPCVNPDGSKALNSHRSRLRMATRKANETRSTLNAEYVDGLSTMERQEIRKRTGTQVQKLADLFGVKHHQMTALEHGRTSPHTPLGEAYGAWLRLRAQNTPIPEPTEPETIA